jgi:hypothetical protein
LLCTVKAGMYLRVPRRTSMNSSVVICVVSYRHFEYA